MVEDNIKITGVDDPVYHDYMEEPKIDLNVPPVNPILPENPRELTDGTEPTYETAIKTFEEPTIDKPSTIKKSKQTARVLKESTRQSSRTLTKPERMIPSMKGKSYEYAATQVNESTFQFDPRVVKTIFTQLSLKATIKTWGKDATNAA
jgi:hypothetical protein